MSIQTNNETHQELLNLCPQDLKFYHSQLAASIFL